MHMMVLPSLLALVSLRVDGGVSYDLRVMQGPVAAVAYGDGETHCSRVRSDEVRDGPSCGAKPR